MPKNQQKMLDRGRRFRIHLDNGLTAMCANRPPGRISGTRIAGPIEVKATRKGVALEGTP